MKRIRYNARIRKKDYNLEDVEFNKNVDIVALREISHEIQKQGLITVYKEEFNTMTGPVIQIDAECFVMSVEDFRTLQMHIIDENLKGIIEIIKK